MKIRKVLLLTLILTVMLATEMTVLALADDGTQNDPGSNVVIISSGECGQSDADVKWTLDNNGVLTISGSGKMADYKEEESPFYNNSNIKRVCVQSGVTKIGQYAFYKCPSIESAELGDGIATIGKYAFDSCTVLSDVNIPDSVSVIGAYAFADTSISDINIPNGVVTIYGYAFGGTNLTTVSLPESVNEIGINPFFKCSSLTSIAVDTGNEAFCSVDGVLYNKKNDTLISYPLGEKNESFTVPQGVQTIGRSAFYGCPSIKIVELPEGIESIGKYAFMKCDNLCTVNIPDSISTIDECAFSDTAISYIDIPEGVITINSRAFRRTKLIDVTIPESVQTLADDAFLNVASLCSINIAEGNTNYCSKDGVLFNKEMDKLLFYPIGKDELSYTVPDGVKVIGEAAFSGAGITSVTFPVSLESIDKKAFSDSALKTVYYSGSEYRWDTVKGRTTNSVIYHAERIYNNKDLQLEHNEITISECEEEIDRVEYTYGNTEDISSVKSENPDIVIVKFSDSYVEFYPLSEGATVVTVKGNMGTVIKVKVKVTRNAIKEAIDSLFSEGWSDYTYGTSNICVSTLPGASITLKIGKDKYKSKAPKKRAEYVDKTIKLKKYYDVGTKISITIKKGKAKKVFKNSIVLDNSNKVGLIHVHKKTISFSVSATKGDTFTMTVGGRTYKKKIKKNNYKVVFKTRSTIKKNAKVKYVLKNKFNTKIDSYTARLKNGYWQNPTIAFDA